MTRILLVLFVLLAFASFAMAQITQPTTDVLGAHLNYGRGCTAATPPIAAPPATGRHPAPVWATRCCGAKM